LAALAAATANALLVIFVLAVAVLPAKLADSFWLLALTGAFCTNGFLGLLAVLLHEPLVDAVLKRLCQAVQPAVAAPTGTEILRQGGL